MRDKMIRDRRKSGDSVIASIDTHLEEVVVPLEVVFAEYLEEGEELPDLRTLFRILQRMLAAAIRDMVEAADRHLRELDNDIRLRRRRDELIKYLGTRVRELRALLEGLYGKGSARTLAGIKGRVEVEPVALLAQVEHILLRFGHPDLELAPPGFGTRIQPADVIEEFEPGYKELGALVSALTQEDRRSDATLIAKNDAKSYYEQQFRWIAGCLTMLYHLAGLHELAERIKPSTRRPGRTQADVAAEQAEGSAEASDSSSEESGVSDDGSDAADDADSSG